MDETVGKTTNIEMGTRKKTVNASEIGGYERHFRIARNSGTRGNGGCRPIVPTRVVPARMIIAPTVHGTSTF